MDIPIELQHRILAILSQAPQFAGVLTTALQRVQGGSMLLTTLEELVTKIEGEISDGTRSEQ